MNILLNLLGILSLSSSPCEPTAPSKAKVNRYLYSHNTENFYNASSLSVKGPHQTHTYTFFLPMNSLPPAPAASNLTQSQLRRMIEYFGVVIPTERRMDFVDAMKLCGKLGLVVMPLDPNNTFMTAVANSYEGDAFWTDIRRSIAINDIFYSPHGFIKVNLFLETGLHDVEKGSNCVVYRNAPWTERPGLDTVSCGERHRVLCGIKRTFGQMHNDTRKIMDGLQ